MIKQGVFLLLGLSMSGCAFNGLVTPSMDLKNEELKITGIPLLAGMSGSSVRIDDEWILTAGHNNFILTSEWYPHSDCDIALVKEVKKGVSQISMTSPKVDETLYSKGYFSSFMIPVKTEGVYIEPFKNFECLVGFTNAAIGSGMSGGGTYNNSGELVGINAAIVEHINEAPDSKPTRKEFRRKSLFVPVCSEQISSWITEVTGKKYCH